VAGIDASFQVANSILLWHFRCASIFYSTLVRPLIGDSGNEIYTHGIQSGVMTKFQRFNVNPWLINIVLRVVRTITVVQRA